MLDVNVIQKRLGVHAGKVTQAADVRFLICKDKGRKFNKSEHTKIEKVWSELKSTLRLVLWPVKLE